jgi:glycosyltransferase involved in cell wall biosynthesis
MKADLSVVMPVRDAEAFIGEAISSVLERADGLLELIVIDDGSTDRSAAVARAFGDPVRVIAQAPSGPAAARNLGLSQALGALIGFLDADDIWLADAPDPRRRMLASDPSLDGVWGCVQRFAVTPAGNVLDVLEPYPLPVLGSGLFRRRAFELVGPLDVELSHAEDFDWVVRARELGLKLAEVPDVVFRYRQRPGSLVRDHEGSEQGLKSMVHKALLRRRAREETP